MYEDGYGCGVAGFDWLATVAGQFLSPEQRRDLYDGWRAGLRDLDAYRRDMAEGADQRAREREMASELVAVCDDDVIPF